ncbi:hypothetical protein [Thermaurantiacus sp.]
MSSTPSLARIPLWVTLVPLAVGVVVWFFLWTGFRDRLDQALAETLPAGTSWSIRGFPYRLEARTGPVALSYEGKALRARLDARQMIVNRQPWRTDRQVVNLEGSQASLALQPLAGISATIAAEAAQASLRTEDGRVARLSIVWERPGIRLGFLAQPLSATSVEAHLRETPAAADPNSRSPVLPVQDQLVLRASDLRLGEGSPLRLMLDAELTAARPIRSFTTWEKGGTAEIRDLVLSDSTGDVLRLSATLSPGRDGRLYVAGTLTTVCPASVRAAFAGLPPVSEKRARRPVTLAFTAVPGVSADVAPPEAGKPPPPVRAQEPDCPRLR